MAIFTLPIARVGDDNFRVGSGYKLYFCEAGTLTPKDAYTDNTYATPLSNPVVADGNGRFPVIWTTGDYKVILKTDEDVTVWTVDNYSNDTASTRFAEGVLSAAGSAANVITANLTTTPGSLVDQLQVVVELQHGANTAAAVTFNLNSLGAKTVRRDNNQPLAIGDTGGSGYKLYLSYSSANDVWILLNPVNPIGQGLEWKRGLKVTNNAADSEHDIDVASGSILDSTEARIINLPSSITKRIDAAFAVGTGNGGLSNQDNSGVVQADTFYGVFLISTATGTTDAIFATTQANALADTVAAAAGYTFARLIDVIKTDGSANIINTVDGGNGKRLFKANPAVVTTTASGSAALRATPVPPFMIGNFTYNVRTSVAAIGAAESVGLLTSPYQDDTAPTTSIYTVKAKIISGGAAGVQNNAQSILDLKVNGSSQIRHREATITGDSTTIELYCNGWTMDYTITDLV